MARFTVIAAATTASACLLTGCHTIQPTPAPTLTPQPSPTCTPEAGGPEYACSEYDYEQMKAKDALYAQAEAVWLKYWAENIRINREGGAAEPTKVLLETAAGDALESIMDTWKDQAERGTHTEGSDPTIKITRVPGLSRGGSVVTLLVCVDSRGWEFRKGDEVTFTGRLATVRVFFGRIEDALKMTYVEGKWVDSCG